MKFRWTLILTLAVALAVALLTLGWLIWFGTSDFRASPLEQADLIEYKPWRPWARLVFAVLMGGVLIVGTTGFLKLQANR